VNPQKCLWVETVSQCLHGHVDQIVRFPDMQRNVVLGAERNTGIGHWESKWEIEKHIRSLGLRSTIVRPAGFMENYYVDQVEIGILLGKLMDPVRADKPYQTIAPMTSGRS
jgi:hypothetical protein